MKKGIFLTSLLVLSIVSCTNPILNNTSQYSDLDKEYSQFKTQALTQSYLKKKMDKWLSDDKYSKNLVREIEYAKFKHKDLLKDIVALQPTMFNSITGNTGVTQKRAEPSFETYIQYINPFATTPVATSASNITSSSFTANWDSVTNATGYKLYIDGVETALGNVTTYTKTGLMGSSSHNYYVKATNSAGESSSSNTINLTLLSASPTAINATNITETGFTANWTAFTGATGYKLYIDGSGTPITLGLVNNYSVTGLTKRTAHNYYIKAILNTGDTSNSNTINLYTTSNEFKVNSYTTSEQNYPLTAMADDGRFVITWQSNEDGYGNIYAQKYNSNGSVNGSEFLVNSYTSYQQKNPSVAIANDGSFVITWESGGQDGDTSSYYNIYAQKYNSDGSVNGSEFKVNTYTTNIQSAPSIAMSGDGKFIISWESYGQDGDTSSYSNVYAQKYNSDGSVNGSEFRVNSYMLNPQIYSSVAMADDGKFVIAWGSLEQDGNSWGVYAQKYNSDGSVNGSEFKVNSYTINSQLYPSVAIASDGKFVITWNSYGQDGSEYGIFAKRYNSDGSVNGSEFLVNTYTANYQFYPSIAMSDDGKFVISWQGEGSGDLNGIFAKRYNSDGSVNGSEFLVNTYTTNTQGNISMGIDSIGNFIVTWNGEGSGDSNGIFAKRFDSNGNVL